MAHDFPCNWKAGFVMDPTKKQRFGYLTAFNGLGLTATLPQDITVFSPYNNTTAPAYTPVALTDAKANVVGVIENFSWAGGVGDPIAISCYMSAENATQLKALKQLTLKTTSISELGWWIANFDEETKAWFEEAHPMAPLKVTAQLNAPGKNDIRFHVADEPVKIAPNIDVNVYNVYFEVVPAANQVASLKFATSATKNVVKHWGLIVGTLAKGALPAST